MKKINAFLLILLSILMVVSCIDDNKDRPKTFSITYKSNIDGIDDITETYTIGDENLFPSLAFSGVSGKYVVGYAVTKTRADNGDVDYNIGDAIDFNTDKVIYTVWKDGTAYTLHLDGRGMTNREFDNLYYAVSAEGVGAWYKKISLDSSEKIEVGTTYERPQYNKTLKFSSNMDGVDNPSDMARKWNVYYSDEPDENDYSYYFTKSSDATKNEDVFDTTKSIDKNTEIHILWQEQQQGGQEDHTYDLPFVSKEGKWFTGWKKPNKALFERFDSDENEVLELTGSWMDEVSKEMGTESHTEEMVNTVAKLEYIIDNLVTDNNGHTQEMWNEELPAAQFVIDLYSMESPYKSFVVSRDSSLFYICIEGEIDDKVQEITYVKFDGKIDNQKYNIELKYSFDAEKKEDVCNFIIVNGVSYVCGEDFLRDLQTALNAIAKAEGKTN